MITLYTFGPYFGLPDGSPFVVKAMTLLRMAGLDYREDNGGYGKAPKGKLPYIDDADVIVADSTFIRLHIEEKYGFNFDAGLSDRDRAQSWAVEKMCEDHLYWALLDARWGDKANFARGPAHFFDAMPAPLRPLIGGMIRNKTLGSLRAHGLGRHPRPQIESLAARDLAAISAILGDRPYLMGEAPCAADAAVFGMVSGVLAPIFDTPIRTAAETHPNLTAYRDRMLTRYFAPAAGA